MGALLWRGSTEADESLYPGGTAYSKMKETSPTMRIILATALIVGSSLIVPANAATTSMIETARAECAQLADEQNFGDRQVQRRNFIQDCLIDRGFNSR